MSTLFIVAGAMVWEGAGVVKEGRRMLGATMPSDSACGTIRGDFWCVPFLCETVNAAMRCSNS